MVMADNVFAKTFEEPFSVRDEWFPLLADNENAPPGIDLPSFAAYRRVSAAVMFFIIRRRRAVPVSTIEPLKDREGYDATGRRTRPGRVQNWVPGDPA